MGYMKDLGQLRAASMDPACGEVISYDHRRPMKNSALLSLILTLLLCSPVQARGTSPAAAPAAPAQTQEEQSAKEIVKRSDDLMRGDTQQGHYTMTVITPNWRRQLEIRVQSKGRDRMLLKILSPAKEKGITTLRVGNEMWNYLPQVERTIKIPPSMMLQPWMGSDFANDDLVKESSIVEDYDHVIIARKTINDRPLVRIQLTPKPRAGVVWKRRVMVIDTQTFVPVRDEFYGKDDELIKVLSYRDVHRVGGRLIPTRWEMVSEVQPGRRTMIEVSDDLVYNEPIDDGVFTLQNIKN